MANTKDTETKIVKAATKKEEMPSDANASKVQIKQVDISVIQAQQARAKAGRTGSAPAKRTETTVRQAGLMSAAKPMPRSSANGAKPVPTGAKPMPKNSVPGNAIPKKKSEVPQNVEKAEEPKTAEVVKPAAEAPKAVKEVKEIKEVKETKEVKEVKEVKPEAPKTSEKTEAPKESVPVKEEKKSAEEPKKQEPKEEKKPETKAEPKKEEKPAAPVTDFLPKIGVKIIRRAADEPAPAPKKPVEKKENKDFKKNNNKDKNGNREGQNRDNKNGDSRNNRNNNRDNRNGNNNGDRKPKEFVGRKPSGNNAPAAENNSPRRKPGDKSAQFNNAPVESTDSRRKGGKGRKDDERDKRSKFDDMPADLSRSVKKKHSKYKEKAEEVITEEQEIMQEAAATGSVVINVPITLAGFCEQIERTPSQAILALMKMGIMANINQNLDEETAVLLGMELGVSVMVNKNEEIELEEGIDKHEDRESDLVERAPIVTVMGHVDHGKTSLLDAIRNTNVTAGEAGGITQHIGASEIEVDGKQIVFLDTPGHEAFTAMRARGAHITDIAVLVVAADDSVMPQTIESISHAKAAGVPIIVAINKMDKPSANPDMVKTDLAKHGVLVEDWGGDVISVPVSAKTGMGIKQLLEMILLQAEVLELKANPNRLAMGTVIEAKLDKTRGPVASLLVTNGTLQAGGAIVVGTASGRVRAMTNPKGESVRKAGPAHAVEITGLTEVPEAGDEFYMVKDEKTAREIAENRKMKLREEVMAKSSAVSLEKLFSQMAEGEIKDLNLIIKADVQGSVGALEQSLEKLHNENVRVRIVHSGVGAINESDVVLASTSNAVIIGFNVRPSSAVSAMADQEGVEIRTYRIIYEIIDDIEAAMKGMLDPEFKEVILGKIEVRSTFRVSNVGTIAGSYVLEGKVVRGAKLRLVRDGIVIHEGEIGSLRRFKDDVREVAAGYECGISIDKFNDIKEGDIIEAFEMQEVKR